jgi:hypothetical protein
VPDDRSSPHSPLRRRRAIALGALTAAAACGDVGVTPGDYTIALATESLQATTWVPTAAEPVSVELVMPRSIVGHEPVSMQVHIHNGSAHPLSIGMAQREPFQILIAQRGVRADSGAVWSPGSVFQVSRGAVITDPLPAGRDTVFEMKWPVQDDAGRFVPPGHYRVRAYVSANLLAAQRIWTDWIPLEVR